MIVIGTIVALAATIWLVVVLRWGGLLAGCALVVLAGSVLGHPFFHASVMTLDRVLWAVVLGWYAVKRWWQGADHGFNWSRSDALVVAFVAILTVNTLTHDWRFDDAQPMSRLLFLYVMPIGLYWVTSQTRFSERSLRNLLIGMAIFGVYLAATAIAEVLKWHWLVVPGYILSEHHPEFLGRGRGPFLNPSANGIYMATCLGALWSAWAYRSAPVRASVLGGTALIYSGVLATLTRCVWLGTACGSMLVMWLTLPQRRRLGVAMLIICFGTLTLVTNWQRFAAFKRDKHVSVSEMAQSASLRPMLAAVAWEMFRDHPLNGVGLGLYKKHDGDYIAQRHVDLPLEQVRPYHQHNVFLSLLTEVGLLGTLPFVLLLIHWGRIAMAIWKKHAVCRLDRQMAIVFLVCLVNYVVNGMFQDVALIPRVNLILFFLAGVLVSVAKSSGVIVPITALSSIDLAGNQPLRRPLKELSG